MFQDELIIGLVGINYQTFAKKPTVFLFRKQVLISLPASPCLFLVLILNLLA